MTKTQKMLRTCVAFALSVGCSGSAFADSAPGLVEMPTSEEVMQVSPIETED